MQSVSTKKGILILCFYIYFFKFFRQKTGRTASLSGDNAPFSYTNQMLTAAVRAAPY